ncbi:hypothetical protein D0Z03_001822 [Geotrichum reessii]|nr:hypothetical protein D0Z03_001822 [Galactomyces reessii]
MFWMARKEGLLANNSCIHAGLRTRLSGVDWSDYEDDSELGFARIGSDDIFTKGTDGIIKEILERVPSNAPVYISVDIDVIDPGMAPGTGTPEVGGWQTRELIRIIRGLEHLNLVGADLVEVAPAYDHAEITALAGAQIIYELKYTVIPKGIWEKLRQTLTLVPNRSSGNPIVSRFRQPVPGSREEAHFYKDPATLPTNDIAENPYYARNHRINYPKTSHFDQATIAGLLTLGSAANPRIADGNAGTQALTAVQQGEVKLTQALAESPKEIILGEILGSDGQPPVPPTYKKKQYKLLSFSEHGMYDHRYPVRTFK